VEGGVGREGGRGEGAGGREGEGGGKGAVGGKGDGVEELEKAVEAGGLGGVVIGADEEDGGAHGEARQGGVEARGQDKAGGGEAAEAGLGGAEAEDVGREAEKGGDGREGVGVF
jgi:hypothetical protein